MEKAHGFNIIDFLRRQQRHKRQVRCLRANYLHANWIVLCNILLQTRELKFDEYKPGPKSVVLFATLQIVSALQQVTRVVNHTWLEYDVFLIVHHQIECQTLCKRKLF